MRTALLLLGLLLLAPAIAYENKEWGVRFAEPEGWEAREAERGALVRYYAPKAPGPRASVGLLVEPMKSDTPLTRSQVLGVVRQLASRYDEYHLEGSKAVELAGVSGHLVSYTAEQKKTQLAATQVFLLRQNRLYVFTLVSSPEAHPTYRQDLQKVLDSVEWL